MEQFLARGKIRAFPAGFGKYSTNLSTERASVEARSKPKAPVDGAFATSVLQFSAFPIPPASALKAWELSA